MDRRGLWTTLPAVAALVAVLGPASATRAAVRPVEWTRLPTTRRVVALTFDCGGSDAGVAKIVAALRQRHAAATFFLTGAWLDVHPTFSRVLAADFAIGNHSYTHPFLTHLSNGAVRGEVMRAERRIVAGTGETPRPLFRFPYGDRDARTLSLVESLGYQPVAWTVDTLGWEGRAVSGGTSGIVARVLAHLEPGEIVLMHVGAAHDGSTPDADALPALLDAIATRGYGFTTLTDFAGETATRIVDDDRARRFTASRAWRRSTSNPGHYGRSHRFTRPRNVADPARFRLSVPTAAEYLVYARWPAARGYNPATRFGVDTASGRRWITVDQRRDGGRWVYLGSFRLRAGTPEVRVSRKSSARGFIVADAVRIVRRP